MKGMLLGGAGRGGGPTLDAGGFERLSEWEVSLAGFCGKDVLM